MRITKGYFRLILTLSLVTEAVGYAVSFITFPTFPPELQAYVRSGAGAIASPRTLLIATAIELPVAIATLVGLFLFWKPARILLVAQSLIGLAVTPLLLGTTVESAWATSLDGLSSILGGVAIALAFFSPVARYFEKSGPEHEPLASAAAQEPRGAGRGAL
jgi:hypothetical protein